MRRARILFLRFLLARFAARVPLPLLGGLALGKRRYAISITDREAAELATTLANIIETSLRMAITPLFVLHFEQCAHFSTHSNTHQ
jgi:UDP-N-acetylglucosamine enolpyruvyl transferase